MAPTARIAAPPHVDLSMQANLLEEDLGKYEIGHPLPDRQMRAFAAGQHCEMAATAVVRRRISIALWRAGPLGSAKPDIAKRVVRGLPVVLCAGSRGWIIAHSASVKSLAYLSPARSCWRRVSSVQAMWISVQLHNRTESQPTEITQPVSNQPHRDSRQAHPKDAAETAHASIIDECQQFKACRYDREKRVRPEAAFACHAKGKQRAFHPEARLGHSRLNHRAMPWNLTRKCSKRICVETLRRQHDQIQAGKEHWRDCLFFTMHGCKHSAPPGKWACAVRHATSVRISRLTANRSEGPCGE